MNAPLRCPRGDATTRGVQVEGGAGRTQLGARTSDLVAEALAWARLERTNAGPHRLPLSPTPGAEVGSGSAHPETAGARMGEGTEGPAP
jgi:hypothetical protein